MCTKLTPLERKQEEDDTHQQRAYFGDDEATRKAWKNLWFHTQDIGYLDSDGFLYYVERLKFTIRRKGENIIPAELEAVVRRHEAVQDCVALGVATEKGELRHQPGG